MAEALSRNGQQALDKNFLEKLLTMELRNGFLATLSEDDRTIFIMRETVKRRRKLQRSSVIRRTVP